MVFKRHSDDLWLQEVSDLPTTALQGETVTAAFALRYLPEGDEWRAEGIELTLASGGSIMLWNETNWTLKVSDGGWPELPDWAWPPEAWVFEPIDDLGGLASTKSSRPHRSTTKSASCTAPRSTSPMGPSRSAQVTSSAGRWSARTDGPGRVSQA